MASLVKHINPRAPKIRKAFSPHNAVQGLPANGVEGLAEVKFKDSGRSGAPMASLNNISSIDEVFRNGAPRDETSLVRVNQVWDKLPEAQGEAFGVNLEATVLEGDGSEVLWFVCTGLFWKQDNIGLIYGAEVCRKGVKSR
jgi:hypothetical protein